MEYMYIVKLVVEHAGFVTSKVACCGQGPYNGLGLCTPASNLCPNRDIYAFWDPFHPSERANRLIVQQILSGTSEYMYPMNLSTIMALDSKNQINQSRVSVHHFITAPLLCLTIIYSLPVNLSYIYIYIYVCVQIWFHIIYSNYLQCVSEQYIYYNVGVDG